MSEQRVPKKGLGKLTGFGVSVLILLVVIIAGTVVFIQHHHNKGVNSTNGNSIKKASALKHISSDLTKVTIPSELVEAARSSSNPNAGDQPNTTIAYSIKPGATVTLDSLIKEFEAQGFQAGQKSDQEGTQTVTLTPTTNQSKLQLIVSIDSRNTVYIRTQEFKRTDQ